MKNQQTDSKGTAEAQQSLVAVAHSGDRLATLQLLRDRLAADLDATFDAREVAALALRLTDVLDKIDAMPVSREVSPADEIAERRAARRGARAKGSARAAGAK